MFHVAENKGKTFSNGGFGMALPKELHLCKRAYNLYLWIEEALFLHDSGLAAFLNETQEILTTQQLYLLLQDCDIELPVYRVYAHLRSQTYRVLRYKPQDELRKTPPHSSLPSPPKMLQPAWQVYFPNANFRKTNPGPPDFLVAITSFTHASPTFARIRDMMMYECSGVALKLAAVSDSGTVVMFGLSDYAVPDLSGKDDAAHHEVK
jgi:hypothetical protein